MAYNIKGRKKKVKPVLIEVRINGRNSSIFEVGRSRKIGKTFSEIDGIRTLSEIRKLLNWGRCSWLCKGWQFLFHFCNQIKPYLLLLLFMNMNWTNWGSLLIGHHFHRCHVLINSCKCSYRWKNNSYRTSNKFIMVLQPMVSNQ